MGTGEKSLLGVGFYTVPEAAQMTGVSAGRIRRWLLGYTFKVGEELHASQRLWAPDLERLDEALALSFRDLIEVRFVDYFRTAGISWKMLREVGSEAAEMVGSTHPFSTQQFKTNGRKIFRELGGAKGKKAILDVLSKQHAIATVVAPSLYEGLEYYNDNPARWFPVDRSKRVVIDPAVAFGQPSLNPEGVPTAVLARAFRVEQSVDKIARWYRVPKPAVRAALKYEQIQIAA